jgi:hypothetical protein
MVQLSGPIFYLGDTIETLRESARVFAARLYETGAGTSEIRRMLTGRELYAETL